jgi:hypothetical protein
MASDVFGLSLILGRTAAAGPFDVDHLAKLNPVPNQAALRAMRKPVAGPQDTELDDGEVQYWQYPEPVTKFMDKLAAFFKNSWISGGIKVFFLRTLFEPDPRYRLTCSEVLLVRPQSIPVRHLLLTHRLW